MTEEELTNMDFTDQSIVDQGTGYVIHADISVPEELIDFFDDLPLWPQKYKIMDDKKKSSLLKDVYSHFTPFRKNFTTKQLCLWWNWDAKLQKYTEASNLLKKKFLHRQWKETLKEDTPLHQN